MDSPFRLPSGLTLDGRYEIDSPISSGAMGAVYRARSTTTGEPAAVKHVMDTRFAARFEVEARLLSLLRHPRVVEILDYFQDDSGQYLVMQLVEGIDLHKLVQQRGTPGLPIEEAVELATQACEALQYVHEQQIIHRDVKPQNMILGADGVVLVDFGIARMFLEDEEERGTEGIGTSRYMAPEVFAGGSVSPRADVFGLAATLWTLLTGKAPVYANPTKLSDIVPSLPRQIEQAIDAGLEMIPERRIASVAALARALGSEADSVRGESLALSVERPTARRNLMEAIVRASAGVFDAAASSIALIDATTGELVYQSAWGAGAREIVGVRLLPGHGLAGTVVQSGQALAVGDCRNDARFAARIAAGTGYVPYTMLVVPLIREGQPIGVLSLLDRRDGSGYGSEDEERASLFAELAVAAIETDAEAVPRLGGPVHDGR